ncbi:MAG: hypothetical protein FWG16_04200 [Micrococcales bacterium]|nr:hypothetical protein [Micrococcales bacterium]
MPSIPSRVSQVRLIAAVAVLATVGLLPLTACSSDKSAVASLDRNPSTGSQAMTQLDSARAMVTCLQEAGVPAEIQPWDDNQGSIGFDAAEPYYLSVSAESLEFGMDQRAGGGDYQQSQDKMTKLAAPYLDQTGRGIKPFLFLGEADYSEAFGQCLEQTGYTAPVPDQDPADELKQKQATAKAGTDWANCARLNGFPEINDPDPPKADNWQTTPSVELPNSITVEELRALLEVCPNFDRAGREAWDQAAANPELDPGNLEYPESPMIEVAPPDDAAWEDDGNPEVQRYQALMDLLLEAEAAYWDEHFADTSHSVVTQVG